MNERTRKGRWIVRERRRCRRQGFCAVCIRPDMRRLLRDVLDFLDLSYHQLLNEAEEYMAGNLVGALRDSPEAPPGGVTDRQA